MWGLTVPHTPLKELDLLEHFLLCNSIIRGDHCYPPYFMDGETEAQRSEVPS